MIAYKGFRPGMICIGYQFQMGLNVTEKANCRQNGFHCAEDPLDCLSYYSDVDHSEYYIVNAGGDIDEDGTGTRISCTELTLIRRLTADEFLLLHANYAITHPAERQDTQKGPFHIAYSGGLVSGKLDDWLCSIKEADCVICQVDGVKILPDTAYTYAELEAASR